MKCWLIRALTVVLLFTCVGCNSRMKTEDVGLKIENSFQSETDSTSTAVSTAVEATALSNIATSTTTQMTTDTKPFSYSEFTVSGLTLDVESNRKVTICKNNDGRIVQGINYDGAFGGGQIDEGDCCKVQQDYYANDVNSDMKERRTYTLTVKKANCLYALPRGLKIGDKKSDIAEAFHIQDNDEAFQSSDKKCMRTFRLM